MPQAGWFINNWSVQLAVVLEAEQLKIKEASDWVSGDGWLDGSLLHRRNFLVEFSYGGKLKGKELP